MQKIGEIYYGGPLRITDQDGNPVTGLHTSDFVIGVFLNGAPATLAVTIGELGNGLYQGSMLPPTAGTWTLTFSHPVYAPIGFADNVEIEEYSFRPIPVDQVVTGTPDAILDSIMPADFRTYFYRDFPYLPAYDNTKGYFIGDVVSLTTLGVTNFYKCTVASTIGVAPYPATAVWQLVSKDPNTFIMDIDIQKAMDQGRSFVNPSIFESNQVMVLAYYYASAHYLVKDLKMAESGIDSTGEGVMSSKSVGSVSVSYNIPEEYKDAQWSFFAETGYGKKFLSLIMPRLVGRIGIAYGNTQP